MNSSETSMVHRFVSTREALLLLINVAIFAFLAIMRPEAFASWTNLKAVLSLMTYDLLLAMAMTVVLIVRGIDLSVGSVLALTSVTMALLMRDGVPVIPAVFAGLAVALACGLINGLLIAKAGILPFLVTLGMMSVARGLATVLTTGQYISFPRAERWFTQFGRFEFRLQIGDSFYGIPLPLLIVLAVILLFGLLLNNLPLLSRLFYVGESPEAAKLSGIRVDRHLIASYLIAAAFVWFAAVLMTSATRIGYANYGIGAELRALAAAIVGGASISGGSGSIVGTFLGVLMLALIGNGFILMNGNPNWQQATVGIVLIAAVAFDAVRRYRTGW
ncbi:ABC transporter permease [Oricola indica]|uniref:ABC transporter permease n=1 Tax=Oricola indica TaxID=2872591 RepID=UPI001CBDF16B|nr:ABC transporter permease [Oricola indica]